MLHLLIESGHFLAERNKVKQLNSRLLMSAVSVVEAAYWLIGGNRFEQALVMLDSAIELVLKGELERIHRILIADTKNLGDFQILKSLLKDAFRQHPSGKDIPIQEFDIERTIYFETAFDRVAELYPTIREHWRRRLLPTKGAEGNALHALRNDIVHYGGDEAQRGQYVAAIVEVALPFLEEILALITQHEESPVSLPHLLMEWIYREVGVAQAVLKDLRENDLPPASYAIAPLAHHIVWSYTRWPSPQDDLEAVADSGEWYDFAERQKYPEGWDGDLTVEVNCPICRSMSAGGSYVPAKVLLQEEPLDQKLLVPEGFLCFVCGLLIKPTERYLAKHFVPRIPEETAAAFLKDIGVINPAISM
jgi:hypothetical protein